MKKLAAVALTSLLSACAVAPGPQFSGLEPTTGGSGDVYVYREPALFASGQAFSLLVDGQKAGDLYNGSYLKRAPSPGKHTLKIVPGGLATTTETVVDVQPERRGFYRVGFPTGVLANAFFIGLKLEPKDEGVALGELAALKRAE